MSRKEYIQARLDTLSDKLGRPMLTTGTLPELEQRLREAEDELASLNDDDPDEVQNDADGESDDASDNNRSAGEAKSVTAVTAGENATVRIADGNSSVHIELHDGSFCQAMPGSVHTVTVAEAALLERQNIAVPL